MKCEEFEVVKFSSKEEYLQWLSWQSPHVKAKAKKFHQTYGDNVIPVIITLSCDTWGDPGAGVHIFVHPAFVEQVLKNVVFEADEC